MDPSAILFYLLAGTLVFFSLKVLISPNPINSALYLALTMVTMAFMYILLQAYFIAGVQLAVYAGAVMVLFVMVLMLFDLKKERLAFSKGVFSGALKIGAAAFLCGSLIKSIELSMDMVQTIAPKILNTEEQMASTADLAKILFTKYLFAFEALGLLLLLIAVGVVAVSRTKGGTHAKS